MSIHLDKSYAKNFSDYNNALKERNEHRQKDYSTLTKKQKSAYTKKDNEFTKTMNTKYNAMNKTRRTKGFQKLQLDEHVLKNVADLRKLNLQAKTDEEKIPLTFRLLSSEETPSRTPREKTKS